MRLPFDYPAFLRIPTQPWKPASYDVISGVKRVYGRENGTINSGRGRYRAGEGMNYQDVIERRSEGVEATGCDYSWIFFPNRNRA